jgi:hypothetical protein
MSDLETQIFESILEAAAKLAPPMLELLRSRIDSMIAANTPETRAAAVAAVRAEDEAVVDEIQRAATPKG